MSMDSQAERHIAASLAHRAGVKATAIQIADAVAAAWQAIDAALTPIVGPRGVAALYQRSLHLNRLTHTCLGPVAEAVQTSLDPAPLQSALAQQAAGDAAAIGAAVFQTFYELLTTLVGPSLTERLLRSVWAHFLSGPPAQDN
jgi:hypothetical protein